jgi:nickel-dependent lactate racemase
MIYFERGAVTDSLSDNDLKEGLNRALDALGRRAKVLALPPDFTRYHSRAGLLTEYAWEYYRDALTDVMPALGTHSPMTGTQISEMFGRIPSDLFRVHDWRNNLETLGRVPASFIKEVSEGKLDYDWPAQVNTLLVRGGFDLILSIGQVVPHEVIGMANYNKNVFVGTGGQEGINKSHFLGAVYGMERIMGRADTPVRQVLNYASDHFAQDLPIVYVGDDVEVFHKASELSLKVNFTMLEQPIRKVIVYLDPAEFKSSWLGHKSVYRTRMAIADGGELIVLAPGVREFGEDPDIDRLIRKYGFVGTERILEAVDHNEDLKANLSAAAHLIHASSEGRFTVTYAPGHLSRDEIQSVGLRYADLGETMKRYNPATLRDGWNDVAGGETIYYISNPALGLWAHRDRFGN